MVTDVRPENRFVSLPQDLRAARSADKSLRSFIGRRNCRSVGDLAQRKKKKKSLDIGQPA